MKRILLTGATTPVGRALVDALIAHPRVERVLAVGIEPESAAGLAEHPTLEYRAMDLTRSRNIRELLFRHARRLDIDAIVHSALHRSMVDSGRRVRELNVKTTRELLRLSERHPTIRRFVYRSDSEIYRIQHDLPSLLREDHPLALEPSIPQRIRDRIEADMTVCSHMGMSSLHIVVLRCAEVLAPNTGSQLWDYLQSSVCLRPLGFDPMLNVISERDVADALLRALVSDAQGVFNIPGADTLPLTEIVARFRRRDVPVPEPLLAPLYRLRAHLEGTQFRYRANRHRFHFSGVLDGRRAHRVLGYRPSHPIAWPHGRGVAMS